MLWLAERGRLEEQRELSNPRTRDSTSSVERHRAIWIGGRRQRAAAEDLVASRTRTVEQANRT